MVSSPASILEKSIMSSTRLRSNPPDFLIFSEYSLMVPPSASLKIISFIPIMALIGVLISWDMLERNEVLASFAAKMPSDLRVSS